MKSVCHVMCLKEIMIVLILIGFCYILQSRMVHGDMVAHKHSVKIVKNAHGDVFDCVDINKQPAFDNSALKNHAIQIRPTSFPEGAKEAGSNFTSTQYRFLNEVCPIGTIPIIRHGKSNGFIKKSDSGGTVDVQQENDPVSHLAQNKMRSGRYYGTTAKIDVYGIPQVSANQSSSSAIWILHDGDGYHVESIVVGWMVNPSLYGDTNTRLFTKWTGYGSQTPGCHDLMCPGFVQVNRDIALGGTLEPLSVYNGDRYYFRFLVFKDRNSGDWWLAVGRENHPVGYWPKSLFNSLKEPATRINWGGEVVSPLNEGSPPMGNGHFPDESGGNACPFYEVYLDSEEGNLEHIAQDQVTYEEDDPHCYGVSHLMYTDIFPPSQGFFFGGPGNCAWM